MGREEWIYYSIYPTQSQAAASPYEPFSITLSPSSLSNTYIYILKDDYPDLTSFDYRNGVLDVNEDGETLNTITIAIGDPTSNMYYIGVYSQNSNQVTYSISASFSGIEICNEQCSAHGACVEGINSCTCNDGYSGSYCQTCSFFLSSPSLLLTPLYLLFIFKINNKNNEKNIKIILIMK